MKLNVLRTPELTIPEGYLGVVALKWRKDGRVEIDCRVPGQAALVKILRAALSTAETLTPSVIVGPVGQTLPATRSIE